MAARLGKLLFFDGGFSGRLGPYNVWNTNGALGNEHHAGEGVVRVLPRPADRRRADHRSRPNATSLGVGLHRPERARPSSTPPTRPSGSSGTGAPTRCGARRCRRRRARPSTTARGSASRTSFNHYRADYRGVRCRSCPTSPTSCGSRPTANPASPLRRHAAADARRSTASTPTSARRSPPTSDASSAPPSSRRRSTVMAGDDQAMTPAAIRGAKLFVGKAACDECHRGAVHRLFHNIGAPRRARAHRRPRPL